MVIDLEARCDGCGSSIFVESAIPLSQGAQGARSTNVDSLERVIGFMVQGHGPKRLPAPPETWGRPVCSMATIKVRFVSPLGPLVMDVPRLDRNTNPWARFSVGHDVLQIADCREAM